MGKPLKQGSHMRSPFTPPRAPGERSVSSYEFIMPFCIPMQFIRDFVPVRFTTILIGPNLYRSDRGILIERWIGGGCRNKFYTSCSTCVARDKDAPMLKIFYHCGESFPLTTSKFIQLFRRFTCRAPGQDHIYDGIQPDFRASRATI